MKSMIALSALAVLLTLAALLGHRPPEVEVVNASGVHLDHFSVEVRGQIVAEGSLRDGDFTRWSVAPRREGPVLVNLHFADGKDGIIEAGWFNPGQAGLASLEIVAVDSVRVERR